MVRHDEDAVPSNRHGVVDSLASASCAECDGRSALSGTIQNADDAVSRDEPVVAVPVRHYVDDPMRARSGAIEEGRDVVAFDELPPDVGSGPRKPPALDDEIVRRINDELVAAWGNLVNRVVSMTGRYFDGVVPTELDPACLPNGSLDQRGRSFDVEGLVPERVHGDRERFVDHRVIPAGGEHHQATGGVGLGNMACHV